MIQLTPEQQRQLELIDKMPYTVETEADEGELKSNDDKEKIMGLLTNVSLISCCYKLVHSLQN